MTQHTETATPKRYDYSYSHGGMIEESSGSYVSHDDYAVLQAKLTTARLELSAERDAVAQYIGERNELQAKLDEANNCIDGLGVNLRAAHKHGDTLRTQLARAKDYHGVEGYPCPLCDYRDGVFVKNCYFHEQLAQSQNEAQSARLIIKAIISDLPVSRDWLDPSTERAAFNFLSTISPNSAEGEPG